MKRIKTIETRDLKKSVKTGGCGRSWRKQSIHHK